MGSRAGRSVSSVSDTLRAECPVTPSREHDRLLLSAAEAASRVARYRIHAEAIARSSSGAAAACRLYEIGPRVNSPGAVVGQGLRQLSCVRAALMSLSPQRGGD